MGRDGRWREPLVDKIYDGCGKRGHIKSMCCNVRPELRPYFNQRQYLNMYQQGQQYFQPQNQ